MIAVIQVKMNQGVSLDKELLRKFAGDIYPIEVPLPQDSKVENLRQYVNQLHDRSAYICDPDVATKASFLLINSMTFEIVIETFYQGHLIKAAEGILHVLKPYLKRQNIVAEIIVFCKAGDAQIYITGRLNSFFGYLRDEMKEIFFNLVAAIVLLIVAKAWLDQYFQEAIAVCIGLSLSVFIKILSFFMTRFKKNIHWSVKHD